MRMNFPIGALLPALLLSGCAAFLPPVEERISAGTYLPEMLGRYRLTRAPSPISLESFYAGRGPDQGPLLDFDIGQVYGFSYSWREFDHARVEGQLILLRSPLEAWGLENRLRAARSGGGEPGAAAPGSAFFTRDKVLVNLDHGATAADAVRADSLKKVLAATLPGGNESPREVSALAGIDAVGEPYFEPTSFLGSTLLAPALAAPLKNGAGRVFIVVKGSAGDASRDFERFLASLEGRRGISFVLGIGETAGCAWDERSGWVNLAREGNILAGAAGFPDPSAGWPLVTAVLAALRK